MKKIIYISIALIVCYGFAGYARAAFDPGSQSIVDFGDVSDAQISSAESSALAATTTTPSYEWFTPALQAQLDSMDSATSSIIDWASAMDY